MSKMPKKAMTALADTSANQDGNGAQLQPIQIHAETVATLRDLRKATHHTQDDLAVAMGVGQGTISRIEKRRDMLVSTLQHYVEGMGGTLQILATFPNRPPLRVECLGKKSASSDKDLNKNLNKKPNGSSSQPVP
jgi:transcriptional regulator with XRE-family HTH domain